ncbi:hypothetical protein HJG60_009795 [Phyllostomus discolor]|uniref:Uncharacterized protein n=1 Tax=Phyllostomus discolor TaxID=89673 RepID=A0A834EPW8_9CHIR|nr:hypothetical protein HJG60_009795 [Phyllostomus discolor]
MNQLKDLLQEHDTFKQQVKIMEEKKKHVITTAPNTQSKATQFQKQLQQLQIQVLIDNDNNSKLQVNSTDLIQNSKGNEIKLKNLKEDLAQIQLSIGHICNAKDAPLGDLDFFSLQASTGSFTSESEGSFKTIESDDPSASSKLLQEEVDEITKSSQEKDTNSPE